MARDIFVTVLRAGHLQAGPDYRIERRVCAGHDLLLCLRGRGNTLVAGCGFPVGPGQLAWLNGHHPHSHRADCADPWELLWVRMDGRNLDQFAEALEIQRSPVFHHPDPNKLTRIFRRILHLMRTKPPCLDALLHAEANGLIAGLFEARQHTRNQPANLAPQLSANLQKAVDDLNLYYYRRWRVDDLARGARMSPAQFYRAFRKEIGLSPIVYLRNRRIDQAKRRLAESIDAIKEIAEQVGYSDQFYFSRDFKKNTGLSPSEFRLRELGAGRREVPARP
jgi:AraC-like DNA-binding protein